MTGKYLGKITHAQFGVIEDYPYLMGMDLMFCFKDGSGIGTGGKYTWNCSSYCEWDSEETKKEVIYQCLDIIKTTLSDAQVSTVQKLIGKPVEVTIEQNTFKDFRILTEVI